MLYGIDLRGSSEKKKKIRNKRLFFYSVLVILCSMLAVFCAWVGGRLGINGPGIFSFIVGCILSVLLCVLVHQIIKLLIYSASELLFDPYGMADRESAFKFLYNYLIYGDLPFLIVTKGTIDERSKDSPLVKLGGRGPGIIKMDDVSVTLVQQGGFHRVIRGSSYFLSKSERIRGFVDLRLQQSQSTLKNVFTKDNIPLEMTVTIEYRIKQTSEAIPKRHIHGPQPQAVINAVLVATDWQAQTVTTIYGKVRDFVAEYNLNDIHGTYPDPDPSAKQTQFVSKTIGAVDSPRVLLQTALKAALNASVEQWGAEVVKVTVDEIVMSGEVGETLRNAWATLWRNKILVQQAETDCRVADVKRETELTNARAIAEAHRIKAASSGEAQMEAVRRADRISQLIGHPIDEKVLNEMLRDAMISQSEARAGKEKRDSKERKGED